MDDTIAIVKSLEDDGFGQFYASYSGRGMFGARCVGITTSDPTTVIEEAASRGLRGAKTDNIGLDWIVYWPAVGADNV